MNEKQFELDRVAFVFFLEEGENKLTNPRAAIDCIAETVLESKYPGSEWLDKSIDLLFDGYIRNYPRPGMMTKLLLTIIAKYLEVREGDTARTKVFENLSWWFVTSEGHFKWLIDNFCKEDDNLRWAMRLVFRRYIRHAEKNNLPISYALNFVKTQLLEIDPAYCDDWTVIYFDPPKENARVYSFQRPLRFTHMTCHPR